jgi:hypothetical protein
MLDDRTWVVEDVSWTCPRMVFDRHLVEEGKYLRSSLRDNLKLISDGDEVRLRCDVRKFAKPIELSVWILPFRQWSA